MAPSLFTLSPTTPIASPSPLPHLRPHPPHTSSLFLSLSLSNAGAGDGVGAGGGGGGRRRRRAAEVMRPRAGGPSTNSLILAFVLPLSLLAGTIFTAARVAARLDDKYLNELAMNKAIMEENEAAVEEDGYDGDDEEEGNAAVSPEKEEQVVALPRARNRPIREVFSGNVIQLYSNLNTIRSSDLILSAYHHHFAHGIIYKSYGGGF